MCVRRASTATMQGQLASSVHSSSRGVRVLAPASCSPRSLGHHSLPYPAQPTLHASLPAQHRRALAPVRAEPQVVSSRTQVGWEPMQAALEHVQAQHWQCTAELSLAPHRPSHSTSRPFHQTPGCQQRWLFHTAGQHRQQALSLAAAARARAEAAERVAKEGTKI